MSSPTAYYNEIEDYAADWLENLIAAGHIAPGVVDRRSIEDVHPGDLRGFTQCHFFAGIGVWSLALRRAGWPDHRPVWTGSCPCQPFSAAGEGLGFADERHLWPSFHWLIQERRPPVVYGEQVASSDVNAWIDLVSTDLEGLDYAVGAVAFPSAGVGAPHIRDRTYWLAHAGGTRLEGRQRAGQRAHAQLAAAQRGGAAGGLADHPSCGRREEHAHAGWGAVGDRAEGIAAGPVHGGSADRMADSDLTGFCGQQGLRIRGADLHDVDGRRPVGGLWADADWIPCRDGKWRPVEPGTFPLAHGAPARVGRLRAYGNAINAIAAEVFIRSTMT